MKKEFIETPFFTKRWYALGFNDEDLAELQQFLLKNPQAGDMMVGTGGLRKIRFAFKGKGKRGSAWVCYVDFAAFERTYLIHVFSKEEKANLTDAEKNVIKNIINLLKEEAKKNRR